MGFGHNGATGRAEMETPHVPPAHRGDPTLSPGGLNGLGLGSWSALVHFDDVPDLVAGGRTLLRA